MSIEEEDDSLEALFNDLTEKKSPIKKEKEDDIIDLLNQSVDFLLRISYDKYENVNNLKYKTITSLFLKNIEFLKKTLYDLVLEILLKNTKNDETNHTVIFFKALYKFGEMHSRLCKKNPDTRGGKNPINCWTLEEYNGISTKVNKQGSQHNNRQLILVPRPFDYDSSLEETQRDCYNICVDLGMSKGKEKIPDAFGAIFPNNVAFAFQFCHVIFHFPEYLVTWGKEIEYFKNNSKDIKNFSDLKNACIHKDDLGKHIKDWTLHKEGPEIHNNFVRLVQHLKAAIELVE